jgi:ribosome biogenesis GTPase / thiamine phosphate phosphatase
MKTGRIIQEHKTSYVIAADSGELSAVVRGKFHAQKDFPKVGDYVEYAETGDGGAVIECVLPRTTEIIRASRARDKRDGRVSTEVLVANADLMFIVMGLDNDFNVSRAERYALLAKQSKVRAVVILSKCDIVADAAPYITQITERLQDMPVHAVSAVTGANMGAILSYLDPGATAVLLGSSGAGKSTITNWLLQQKTQTVRDVRKDDSRGRHTTTARELFTIPTGGYLIDTPGMRELGVLSDGDNEAEMFADIEELKRQCKFADCDHEKSEGCAVLQAIRNGDLDEKRYASFLKLQRGREYLTSKKSDESAIQRKQRVRKLHTGYNKIQRQNSLGSVFACPARGSMLELFSI